MHLATSITEEDMSIFLQETDEQMDLLKNCLQKLIKDEDTKEIFQKAFCAAHNIKGSSSMIEYLQMNELACAVESILNQLRKGTLALNPEIIKDLLNSLDMLRVLKEELVSPKNIEIDITPAIAELERVSENPLNRGRHS